MHASSGRRLNTVYFTICARNYLSYARSLGESLRAHIPGARFVVVLADDSAGTAAYPEDILPMDALGLPELPGMRARYTLLELATAIKPACFEHLLGQSGTHYAVYLDPDIEVFAPLDEVTTALAGGASCVLTPHLSAPLDDGCSPSDLDILASGTFNLGFAAFDTSAESLGFLAWWRARLIHEGYNDPARGQFVDQKWMEFAPSFLPRLHVLRHPGYNVAYWNLAQRPVTRAGDLWQAGGAPLVFFHFSGVVPGNNDVFSKHQDRFTPTSIGPAAELLRLYLEKLAANGHPDWSPIPYAYASFRDGTPIPDVVRRSLGRTTPPESWFDALDNAYWNAQSELVDPEPGLTITRLMVAAHAGRPDLCMAFPIGTRAGRRGLHAWFIAHGAKEMRLDAAQVHAALAGAAITSPGPARLLARIRLALSRRSRR